MGQLEKEKKAPQLVVVMAVAVAMSKEVELEAFGHECVLKREISVFWKREMKF